MKYIVTGGRGTGKSSWLNIVRRLQKNALCFDLDKEVERLACKTVAEIFREEGEKAFRLREKKAFAAIFSRLRSSKTARGRKIFIAVGAGFRFQKQPDLQVIHLRRPSDGDGRILPDRPRLKPKLSLYEESRALQAEREPFYRRQADEVWTRREHWKGPHLSDRLFLKTAWLTKPLFSLTLSRASLPSDSRLWGEFLEKRLQWGLRFFELKDPSPSFAAQIREFVPDEKLLFTSYKTASCKKIKNKIHWCWDLRLGPPPSAATVISLHERRGGGVSALFRKLLNYKKSAHLKAAPLVSDLRELQEGFRFQQEDWENISFLPRSKEGLWGWYRLAFGPRLKLHFIKEDAGGVPDQPFFAEAVHYCKGRFRKGLAGVLGDPVKSSATPFEQDEFFFQKRGIPVFAVPLKEEEMTEDSLKILQKFGFVFFAVTSPLKKQAFLSLMKAGGAVSAEGEAGREKRVSRSAGGEFSGGGRAGPFLSEEALRYKSLNTLILQKGILQKGSLPKGSLQKASLQKPRWRGYNTDGGGLALLKKPSRRPDRIAEDRAAATRPAESRFAGNRLPASRSRKALAESGLSEGRTAVWGGGGVLGPLKRLLPGASFYSARSGRRRFGPSLSGRSPDTVIWAVPRSRLKEGARFPPKSWKPSLVQDINYTEDSPGLEYSAQTGAAYKSGRDIFRKQAARQRALFARLHKAPRARRADL